MKFYCNLLFQIVTLTFILINSNTFGATFRPKKQGVVKFNSLSQWQRSSNWTCTSGCSRGAFPRNGDVVLFGNSSPYWGGASIEIGFNLRGTYRNIEFTSEADGSELIISGNTTVKNINDAHRATITIKNTGSLIVRNSWTLDKDRSTINNNGDLKVNGNLRFATGTAQRLNSSGTLTVENDFSIEGGSLNITGGSVVVKNDWVVPSNNANGNNRLNISSGASMEVKGNVKLNSNQAFPNSNSQINVKGSFKGTCPSGGAGGNLCDLFKKINDASLPVTLVYFLGEKKNEDFLLAWETASEQNSERFDIEASYDKRKWEVIGSEKAQGNSDTKYNYSFLNEGKQYRYYRLAQYDLDGSVEYFGIVYSASKDSDTDVSVYPTLLERNDDCKVFFSNVIKGEKVIVELLNLQGKSIISEVLNNVSEKNNYLKLQIPNNINNGLYVLNIRVGKENYQRKLLIK